MSLTSIPIQDGYAWDADNGAKIAVTELEWSSTGRLYARVRVTAEGLEIAGGRMELSDSRYRLSLAQELSTHNGAKPAEWQSYLLSIYQTLDDLRIQRADKFAPVDLAVMAKPEPREYGIGGIQPVKTITNLYGDSGQGKTLTAHYMALCRLKGVPFLGLPTRQIDACLFLDWDMDEGAAVHRHHALSQGMGYDHPVKGFYFQSLHDPLGKLVDDIGRWCEEYNAGLIIIDSLGPAAQADPLDHQKIIALMGQLRRLDPDVMNLDHQSKPSGVGSYGDRRQFGSAYKGHLARSILQVEMVTNVPGKASVILRQTKNNFGSLADPLAYHIRFEEGKIWFQVADTGGPEFTASDSLPTWQRVEIYLEGTKGAYLEDIVRECEIMEKTASNAISTLRSMGKMPKTPEYGEGGKRIYRLEVDA